MPTTLKNSRLSLVAGQCYFEQHWRGGARQDLTLWDDGHYGYTFNQIRGGNQPGGYVFPWRPSQNSNFWRSYLGGRSPESVDAQTAWRTMVPLKLFLESRPAVRTDNQAERIFYDVYGYPHGIIAALTIQSPRKLSETLDEWRDRTRRLRLERPYSVSMPGGSEEAKLNATDALNKLLDWHRKQYYGNVEEIYDSNEPLSLNLIVQGNGVAPTVPIDSKNHRLLYAVTGWPRNWQQAQLPEFNARCVPTRELNDAIGDVHYVAPRGYTIWRPSLFGLATRADPANRIHTLSCLGHNWLAGLMQAESLRLFAIGFDASPKAQRFLTPDVVRTAAVCLDRLRRGENTYRSFGIKHVLEDSNSKAQVNALLKRHNLSKIQN